MSNYRRKNIGNIKKAISNFNWNKAFENLAKDEKVALLNQTSLNIFRNVIPKKSNCGYQQLPWMTNETKNLLKERSKLTEYFTDVVKEKVIVIKCWKNLHNALERFWKLKSSVFFM